MRAIVIAWAALVLADPAPMLPVPAPADALAPIRYEVRETSFGLVYEIEVTPRADASELRVVIRSVAGDGAGASDVRLLLGAPLLFAYREGAPLGGVVVNWAEARRAILARHPEARETLVPRIEQSDGHWPVLMLGMPLVRLRQAWAANSGRAARDPLDEIGGRTIGPARFSGRADAATCTQGLEIDREAVPIAAKFSLPASRITVRASTRDGWPVEVREELLLSSGPKQVLNIERRPATGC